MRHRPLGIAPGLIAGRRQFGDPILERRIAHVDHAILDRVIEALEPGFGLGRTTFQIGDMEPPLIHPFVAAFDAIGLCIAFLFGGFACSLLTHTLLVVAMNALCNHAEDEAAKEEGDSAQKGTEDAKKRARKKSKGK